MGTSSIKRKPSQIISLRCFSEKVMEILEKYEASQYLEMLYAD